MKMLSLRKNHMTNQEINEAVARKLGWKECECEPQYRAEHTAYMPGKHIMPNYTGSIQAAWEIINQFHAVTIGTELREKDCWFCELSPQIGPRVRVYAETAPLAICEAFLKLP